jgi:predicted ribosome quality control (RQC) complex YloA/Tae2 family protein
MTEDRPEAEARAALSELWGARVQRVDAPSPTLFAVTLYDSGQRRSLIFSLDPQRPNLGVVVDRPTGDPASAFVRRLRVAIENARLIEAHWLGGDGGAVASAVRLSFLRGSDLTGLAVDLSPGRPNVYLLTRDVIAGAADERTRRACFPGQRPIFQAKEPGGIAIIATLEDALARGSSLVQQTAHSADQGVRQKARAQAKTALKRLVRKAAAIRGDLARAESAPLLRREANLLLCHMRDVARGAREVSLTDIASDPMETLTIQLDPSLSAQENAERRFTRARRMERGLAIARARLQQTEDEASALSAFMADIEQLDVSLLSAAALAVGIKVEAGASAGRATTGARKERQTHVPFRTFLGSGGKILVGKGAQDNDALTLGVARPHDIWLHARGLHGAHVVVPRERGVELGSELLLDAAHLAAHFSSARGDTSAEVQHTERRYVRKAKGSAAGAVRIDRERVLLLRVEPERLKRLLASEV